MCIIVEMAIKLIIKRLTLGEYKESSSKNGKHGGDVGSRQAGQARREGSGGDGMIEVVKGGKEKYRFPAVR